MPVIRDLSDSLDYVNVRPGVIIYVSETLFVFVSSLKRAEGFKNKHISANAHKLSVLDRSKLVSP